MSQNLYAIIDVETTGGAPAVSKITEISVFLHDGTSIVREFTSLVNPCCEIPPYIVQFTGITNEMVANAPKFYEIAKDIVEITEGATFVAHNSAFDYEMIKMEFKSLGYSYRKTTLCTVKLSRKFIPGMHSYSLGNLCEDLGIIVDQRHRARGDAEATTRLFELLLQKQSTTASIDDLAIIDAHSYKLHKNLKPETIDGLPDDAGVYYFHDQGGNIIYVGKSKNIRKRVLNHFSAPKTPRQTEMKNVCHDITYEITGSELVALLLESDEIKKRQPLFNRAQKQTRFTWGIFLLTLENGYHRLNIERLKGNKEALVQTGSYETAVNMVQGLILKHGLCQKLCGLYKASGPCFHYQIKQCKGACKGEEKVEEYNLRLEKAVSMFEFHTESFILVDQGRNAEERAVVLVENGRYLGFGYMQMAVGFSSVEQVRDNLQKYENNKDTTQIIKGYLKKNKVQGIIKF